MAQKVMGTLDIDMFILYCNEYAIYIETSEEFADADKMKAKTDGAYRRLTMKNQRAWERAKAIAIEFGFTPSARSRVNTLKTGNQMSEFEKLMKGML